MMRLFTAIIFVFYYASNWSQTITYDTIIDIKEVNGYLDTTYYIKQHVQINKEFLVVDTVRGEQWAFDTYLGALVSTDNCPYSNSNQKFQSSISTGTHIGGSLYYNLPKKWSFRIGTQFTYQKTTLNYTQNFHFSEDVVKEVNDTLDVFFNIIGTDTNYFHIIESNTISTVEDVLKIQNISYTWKIWQLEVPLQVSYGIEKGKWSFNLLAGTSFVFHIKSRMVASDSNPPENINFSFNTNLLLSGQVGFFIGNTTILQIEPWYKRRFTKSMKNILPLNEFYTSIGLKHFF